MKYNQIKKLLVASALIAATSIYSQVQTCDVQQSGAGVDNQAFGVTVNGCIKDGSSNEATGYQLNTTSDISLSLAIGLDQYWGKLDPSSKMDRNATSGDLAKPLAALIDPAFEASITSDGLFYAETFISQISPVYTAGGLAGEALYTLDGSGNRIAPERLTAQGQQPVMLEALLMWTEDNATVIGYYTTKVDLKITDYTGPLADVLFRVSQSPDTNLQYGDGNWNAYINSSRVNSFGEAFSSQWGANGSSLGVFEFKFSGIDSATIDYSTEDLIGGFYIDDSLDVKSLISNAGAGSDSVVSVANVSVTYVPSVQ